MRAVVSKRGVDDGNQKGGGFLQPAKESHYHYNKESSFVKCFLKKIVFFSVLPKNMKMNELSQDAELMPGFVRRPG